MASGHRWILLSPGTAFLKVEDKDRIRRMVLLNQVETQFQVRYQNEGSACVVGMFGTLEVPV